MNPFKLTQSILTVLCFGLFLSDSVHAQESIPANDDGHAGPARHQETTAVKRFFIDGHIRRRLMLRVYGSGYVGTYYDADGNALVGENSYTLRLEPNVPAANFWSVTVYDIENRVVIRNKTGKADLSSRAEGLQVNDDGSIDLHFGPEAPAGKEGNWIQTNPGESWFTYFRAYGPLKPFFEETYPMNKVRRVK